MRRHIPGEWVMEDVRPMSLETVKLRYLERHPRHVSDLLYLMEYHKEQVPQ